MSKTVESKVARRVRGFEGRAKAAEENAARLYQRVVDGDAAFVALNQTVAGLAKNVQEQAMQIDALRAALAVVDQVCAARLSALEQASKPAAGSGSEPFLASLTPAEQPEAAPAIPAGDGTAAS